MSRLGFLSAAALRRRCLGLLGLFFRVKDLGPRVKDLGPRVEDLGPRLKDLRI